MLLDLARAAHWRFVSDLSDLSWVYLQVGDPHAAHWALQWAESLLEGNRTTHLWANWAALQEDAGDLVAAERSYRRALRGAMAEESSIRSRALRTRLARVVERVGGRADEALDLARSVVQAYRRAGDEESALAEDLHVADQLLSFGRENDAAALLARVIGALESGVTLAVDEQIFMHLLNARLSERRRELSTARSALSAAGSLLFDLGRVDELAALASSFGGLELRNGHAEAAAEAFDNAQRFESQLGLGSEAWHGLLGQAQLARSHSEHAAALKLLERARERVDWLASQRSVSQRSDWSADGSFLPVPEGGEVVYQELASLHLSMGDVESLIETISGARERRRVVALTALRQLSSRVAGTRELFGESDAEIFRLGAQIEELRLQLRDEAISPMREEPTRAGLSVAEQLADCRAREKELLGAMAASDPGSYTDRRVSPPQVDQLRGALNPGEVLLLSYDLSDSVVVIALSAREQEVYSLGAPALLAAEIEALWREFGSRRVGVAARRKLAAALGAWGERLLQPASALIGAAHTVFWSPDPSLRSLPLAALPLGSIVLSDGAEVIGLESPRALLGWRDSQAQPRPWELRVVADPAEPSSLSDPDPLQLGAELRARRGRGLIVSKREVNSGELPSRDPVWLAPPRLSAAHRLAQLKGARGPSMVSMRHAEIDDPFLSVLAVEFARDTGLRQAIAKAREVAKKRRRDPLGWAAVMLWFD